MIGRWFEFFDEREDMAQAFNDGPFVITFSRNGWRIEVVEPGNILPVVPLIRIGEIIERLGLVGKTRDKRKAAEVRDALNEMVRTGEIVLVEYGSWLPK